VDGLCSLLADATAIGCAPELASDHFEVVISKRADRLRSSRGDAVCTPVANSVALLPANSVGLPLANSIDLLLARMTNRNCIQCRRADCHAPAKFETECHAWWVHSRAIPTETEYRAPCLSHPPADTR